LVDFRYHLVTIISIFLALAVGIVVGTTALNGPVLDGLRDRNAGLISEKRALQSDVDLLGGEVDTADEFARALAPDLVGGRLDGQGVLLVLGPDADPQVADQLATMITESGARVTARVALQEPLVDPGSASSSTTSWRRSCRTASAPDTTAGRAAAELAAALLVAPDQDPLPRDSAQEIVSAFQEAGLITVSDNGDELAPAGTAVLLAGKPPVRDEDEQEGDGGQSQIEALLAIVGELDGRSGGAVLAGPGESTGDGGLVRALRADSGRDAAVSSVDNVHRAVGQVAVVRALVEQLQGGSGRYGGTGSAEAPVPGAAEPPGE
jgi:hypothetical protein